MVRGCGGEKVKNPLSPHTLLLSVIPVLYVVDHPGDAVRDVAEGTDCHRHHIPWHLLDWDSLPVPPCRVLFSEHWLFSEHRILFAVIPFVVSHVQYPERICSDVVGSSFPKDVYGWVGIHIVE